MAVKTFSKGQLIRATVAIDEDRIAQLKRAPQVAEAALSAAADYWHTGILPRHFEKQAHGRYGYAKRAINYLKNNKKGSKPDLVYSGSMRRELLGRASFRVTGKTTVELKMTARVLNLVPRMADGDFSDYVVHKRGRGYPNLKKEIRVILDEEREALAQVVVTHMERAFGDTEGRESDD